MRRTRDPANKSPQDVVALVWEIFGQNPGWGRHRIAMALWAIGVFLAPSTVRDILLRARPQEPLPAAQSPRKRRRGPVRITATSPNQTWSVDKTRVWRWAIWPTWVLVAVDHFSRKVMCVSPLYGSDGGWVIEAMEEAFRRYGAPAEIISDRDPAFTSAAFQALLGRWDISQRFGRLGGAVPDAIHTGQRWQRPERPAKALPVRMERRHFAEVNVTAFRLAA